MKSRSDRSVLHPGRQPAPSPHGLGFSSLLDGYHTPDQEGLIDWRVHLHAGVTLEDERISPASPQTVNEDIALSVAERPDLAPAREAPGHDPGQGPG